MDSDQGASRIYTQLSKAAEEIRLIRLIPSRLRSSGIRVTLATFQLRSAPSYYALSYVWGDPKDTEEVSVNEQPFRATKNLVSFLREWRVKCSDLYSGSLRRRLNKLTTSKNTKTVEGDQLLDTANYLWIDAICINQSDVLERNHQVKLMKHVYRSASATISWLGIEAEGSSLAMQMILRAGRLAEVRNARHWESCSWLEEMKKEFCDVDEHGDNKTWHVIEILFRREYWSRVWILQEIILPPKVYLMCGSIVCDMRFAMLLALWIHRRLDCETPMIMDRNLWERLASSSFTMKNTLLFTYQLIRHTGSKQRFPIVDQDVADRTKVFKDDFDILNEFSARETTLPEDMIYGVLGLIDFQIEPDYTRPVEATFLEVARIGVERGRLDYILSNAGLGASHRLKKQRKVRVRSWVPEWTTAWDSRHMRYPYYSANQSANLDTSLQAHVNEQGILSIFGVSIGRIRTALLPASRPSLFNIVIDLINDIDIREQYEASMGIPPLQAVIRLLLMDYETHRDTQMRRIDPKLFSSQIDFVNMVRRLMPSSDNGEFLPSWKKSLSCMRLHLNCFGPSFAEWILGPDLVDGNLFATMTFRQAVMQCTESYPSFHWRRPKEENYCIFVTDRGLIGFGPDKMMSSDQLIVCLHCQLPLLLREIPGGGYHLVGTCFVLGLMDGEAFRDNPICTLFKIH